MDIEKKFCMKIGCGEADISSHIEILHFLEKKNDVSFRGLHTYIKDRVTGEVVPLLQSYIVLCS